MISKSYTQFFEVLDPSVHNITLTQCNIMPSRCNIMSIRCNIMTKYSRCRCNNIVTDGMPYVHYLSSSNSPVNVRIGNHICKGRELILSVTWPAKINYLSTN